LLCFAAAVRCRWRGASLYQAYYKNKTKKLSDLQQFDLRIHTHLAQIDLLFSVALFFNVVFVTVKKCLAKHCCQLSCLIASSG